MNKLLPPNRAKITAAHAVIGQMRRAYRDGMEQRATGRRIMTCSVGNHPSERLRTMSLDSTAAMISSDVIFSHIEPDKSKNQNGYTKQDGFFTGDSTYSERDYWQYLALTQAKGALLTLFEARLHRNSPDEVMAERTQLDVEGTPSLLATRVTFSLQTPDESVQFYLNSESQTHISQDLPPADFALELSRLYYAQMGITHYQIVDGQRRNYSMTITTEGSKHKVVIKNVSPGASLQPQISMTLKPDDVLRWPENLRLGNNFTITASPVIDARTSFFPTFPAALFTGDNQPEYEIVVKGHHYVSVINRREDREADGKSQTFPALEEVAKRISEISDVNYGIIQTQAAGHLIEKMVSLTAKSPVNEPALENYIGQLADLDPEKILWRVWLAYLKADNEILRAALANVFVLNGSDALDFLRDKSALRILPLMVQSALTFNVHSFPHFYANHQLMAETQLYVDFDGFDAPDSTNVERKTLAKRMLISSLMMNEPILPSIQVLIDEYTDAAERDPTWLVQNALSANDLLFVIFDKDFPSNFGRSLSNDQKDQLRILALKRLAKLDIPRGQELLAAISQRILSQQDTTSPLRVAAFEVLAESVPMDS